MTMEKKIIYADNAATTMLDPIALDAMLPFLQNNFGNASSPYSFSRSVKKSLQEARNVIAKSIGALPEEIIFTSGGTESDNWALKGLMNGCYKNKNIITSQIEHHAILNSCKALEKCGVKITYLPVDKLGRIKVVDLKNAIKPETTIISIIMANNEIGTIQDIITLGRIAKEHNIPFHTDAVQAVGHIDINVNTMNIDLLSASAHKFNGPKGVGFLYKRKDIKLLPYMDGGAQEYGLRAGTENIANIVGMSIALKNHINNLSESKKYLIELTRYLTQELQKAIPEIIVNGDRENSLPGLVSASIPNQSGEALMHILDMKGIIVSTGAACNSTNIQISHVLKAIKLKRSLALGTLRISLNRYNTIDDIHLLCNNLSSIINKRKI